MIKPVSKLRPNVQNAV